MFSLRRRISFRSFIDLRCLIPKENRDAFSRKTMSTKEDLKFSPTESVVHLIDSFHGLTPFPWWTTISLTAITLRAALFPLTVKQIQSSSSNFKLAIQAWKIVKSQSGESKPSLANVFRKFWKLKKFTGSPHPSWIIAVPIIQIPSFLVFVLAIRKMCAQDWPGFSSGGTLWFSDLTQQSVNFYNLQTYLGPLGVTLPLAITIIYLLNLDLAFRTGRLGGNVSGSVGEAVSTLLRFGLEWLAVPTFLITLQLPQGTLVYWLSSSMCSLAQNLLLGNLAVREKLQLPKQGESTSDGISFFKPEVVELFLKAAESRANNKLQEALEILEKICLIDAKNPRAHYAKGQLHSELKQWNSAIKSYQIAFKYEPESKIKARSLLGIGVSQYKKGDIVGSEKSLLAAFDIETRDIAILMALCSLYKNTGQLNRAKEIVSCATEIDPRCKQWEDHL